MAENGKNKKEESKKLTSIPVHDIKLKKGMPVEGLFSEMEHVGGFSAQHMITGTHIIGDMQNSQALQHRASLP